MKVIQKFLKNNLRNFNYIIYSEVTKEAIFIDPYDISQTLPELEKLGGTPRYLLNTHTHHDHIRENEKFLEMEGVQKLELADGEEFKLSESEVIKAVYTPGHVHNHFCFFLYNKGVLDGIITGDTVFNGGVGNCKNGGDPSTLYKTIRDHFINLDNHINIYPSHDYFLTNLEFSLSVEEDNEVTKKYIERRKKMDLDNEFIQTTIGEEKEFNPFFRVFNPEFKNKFNETEENLFITLRQKRDRW